MKNILRNLLAFNLLAPVWLVGQNAAASSFLGKNLHELRELAAPPSPPGEGEPRFPRFPRSGSIITLSGMERGERGCRVPPLPGGLGGAAFFCRLELKMDKALRTPVRFRLGSQEYVDWLERKSSARFMDFK